MGFQPHEKQEATNSKLRNVIIPEPQVIDTTPYMMEHKGSLSYNCTFIPMKTR